MDLSGPSDFNNHLKEICLDDIPVDTIIYRKKTRGNATPADIILLWAHGLSLSERMEKVLVKILINDISMVFDLDMVKEAISVFESALENTDNSPAERFRLMITLINLYTGNDAVKRIKLYQDAKDLFIQVNDDLDEESELRWKSICKREDIDFNPYDLRKEALAMLQRDQYEEARQIYTQLLVMGFDLPGTLCHLARLHLLMFNELSARQCISQAWIKRAKASKYVYSRILFFRIFFLLIDGKKPDKWICRLKSSLNDNLSFMEWSIYFMLYKFQPRFSPDNYLLITSLADALQNRTNFERAIKNGIFTKFTNLNPESL